LDLAQTVRDDLKLVSREDSSGGKSGACAMGSGDVMLAKPAIERNRFAITLSNLGGGR